MLSLKNDKKWYFSNYMLSSSWRQTNRYCQVYYFFQS